MCDFYEKDEFMDDDYDEGESTHNPSFEGEYDGDTEMDDSLEGDSDLDGEPDEAQSQDDKFTAKDAFLAGAFAAWAFEEGVEERRRKRWLKEQSKRRKRKKFSDDSD